MASIFKRTRSYPVPDGPEIVTDRRGQRFAKWTDRKTGRTRKAPVVATSDGDWVTIESGNYLIAYFDADGKRRQQNSGTPDLATAERIAGQLENQAALRKSGIINATQERFAAEGRRPLPEHVDDFEQFLRDRGNTAKHVRMTCQHIR